MVHEYPAVFSKQRMKYWRGWSFQVRLDKGDSCARHQRLLAAEGNSEDVNHYHLRLRLTLRREKAKSYSRMQNKNPLQGPRQSQYANMSLLRKTFQPD